LLTLVVVALLALLSFRVVPAAGGRAQEIRVEALRSAQFGALEPGRFRSFAGGDAVFYAEKVERAGRLEGVFVQRRNADRLEIAVAKHAEQRGAGQAEQLFVLFDGRRYEGVPGSREWRVVEFKEHGIPVRLPDLTAKKDRRELRSTRALLGSDDDADRAELAWRIAVPVMALVLMMLAVPLSKLRPRQGRFARIGYAVLAYFLYSNLLGDIVWIEKGDPAASWGCGGSTCCHWHCGWLLWRDERPPWRRARASVWWPSSGHTWCVRSSRTPHS
jgi:lipopolysaccharide export system permease protein